MAIAGKLRYAALHLADPAPPTATGRLHYAALHTASKASGRVLYAALRLGSPLVPSAGFCIGEDGSLLPLQWGVIVADGSIVRIA